MFVGNKSKVTLAGGAAILFSDLRVGDRVLAIDGGYNTVKVIHQDDAYEGKFILLNGVYVIDAATPLMTNEGWVAYSTGKARKEYPFLNITKLKKGMQLLGQNEVNVLVDKVLEYKLPSTAELCYISLDGDHTFFCDGIAVHNKGGSSGGSSTTIQKSEPPEIIQPYLGDIAKKAQQAYGQVPQGGFKGDLVAPVDPRQQEALAMQETIARGLGGYGSMTNAIAQQQGQRVLSGDILAPINERFTPQSANTAGVIAAALDPVYRQLTEQVLPGVRSAAVQSGAYGGTRADVLNNQAIADYSREAGNIAANIGYQDFARTEDQRLQDLLSVREFAPELEKLNQAAALTSPELQNQGLQQQLTQGQLLGNVGETNRLFEQDVIDNLYQQYVMNTQTPFVGLDQYAALVNGAGYGGTSTLTGPRSSTGGLGGSVIGTMGGALTGAQLGSIVPGIGTGIGAVGGAILGGLFG